MCAENHRYRQNADQHPGSFRQALRGSVSNGVAALALAVTLGLGTIGGTFVSTASNAEAVQEDFADLVETLLPSVVSISSTQTLDSSRQMEMPQFPPGSPFEDFFKDFFDQRGMRPPNSPHQSVSLGAGFVVDADGYIVTNYHVIRDAEDVSVILSDDTTLKAEIVGFDSKSDLALLKVKADKPLPAVSWGNSDKARVGEWVMAIGNPFGLGGTVTRGIISAKTRDIQNGLYDSFIQTDAAINKGNSGGPLFNSKGEVLGINTVIYSPSGGSVGIGFAVPSNTAIKVLSDLKQYGRTRRGWIGVRIQSVNEDISENLGLPAARGALVAAVSEGGPSAKAGIKVGDVILSFDGHEISKMRSLPKIVSGTDVGKSVPVEIWRAGKSHTLTVKLGELEKAEEEGKVDQITPKAEGPNATSKLADLGVSVAPIDDRARRSFGLSAETRQGVVVTQVDSTTDAYAKGLRPGAVIVRAGQTDISTPKDLDTVISNAVQSGRKTILLLVDTGASRTFVAVKIGKDDKDKN